MHDSDPLQVFPQLEREMHRVGVGVDALIAVDRELVGPTPPGVPTTPQRFVNWESSMFVRAVGVLQSLPSGAGKTAFVEAMLRDMTQGNAGA